MTANMTDLRFLKVGRAYSADAGDGVRVWIRRNTGHTWTLSAHYRTPTGREWEHLGRYGTIADAAAAANELWTGTRDGR